MAACATGHEDIVRRLCEVPGIDLNCTDVSGRTALHHAVEQNRLGCVRRLRAVQGVSWNVEASGWSPLSLAADRGRADILQVILSVPEPDLCVSLPDPEGRSVGQVAVESRHGDAIRCVQLLSQDPRINWNIRNQEGDTPELYCKKRNKKKMYKESQHNRNSKH